MEKIELDVAHLPAPPDARQAAGLRARLAAEHATGRHAWLALPADTETIAHVLRLAQPRLGRFRHLVVIGIGGSALGLRALVGALRRPSDWWDLHVLDTTDPWLVGDTLARIELQDTLVVAVSKSGSTLETVAVLGVFTERLRARKLPLADHLVVVTDPQDGPLRVFADKHGLERAEIPPAVGGRFSVLSPAALLPAALLNIDIAGIVQGAARARRMSLEGPESADWAAQLGLAAATLAQTGSPSLVFMPYSARLRGLAPWLVQLWDESLGKEGKGQTVIAAEGPADQHAQMQLVLDGPRDKAVLFVRLAHHENELRLNAFDWAAFGAGFLKGRTLAEVIDAQWKGTAQACTQAGRPNMTLALPRFDAAILGELLMGLQSAVAIAAMVLGVDAYGQPAVERGKQLSRKLLEGK